MDVPWDQATRAEARDYSRWIQLTDKPGIPVGGKPASGTNPVTGKPRPGRKYASATRGHSESVLRGFYDFHRDAGSGPMVNPFPLVRRGTRPNAHHNPLEPFRNERSGLYRPRQARRVPRSIPDCKFNELHAELGSHRDRALVAFWVSSGARASELLGVCFGDADLGQQLISVVRKGSRAIQQLPAAPDAFVWLRLYQEQMRGLVPTGRDDLSVITGNGPGLALFRREFRDLGSGPYFGLFREFCGAGHAGWWMTRRSGSPPRPNIWRLIILMFLWNLICQAAPGRWPWNLVADRAGDRETRLL